MELSQIKCRIGVSPIHGVGVFALKDIEKGERLFANELFADWHSANELDNLTHEIREYIITRWPAVLNGSDFVFPFEILVCSMNHSTTPNYNPKDDTALCNIQKGEEILEDYGIYTERLCGKQDITH